MILVDSSVWIDFLRGRMTPQVDRLDQAIIREPVAIGDLIATEVLQGIGDDRQFERVKQSFESLNKVDVSDYHLAVEAAGHFRYLRRRGVTIRGTVDLLIATRCIRSRFALLYSDRDFHPFVEHLGLQPALALH